MAGWKGGLNNDGRRTKIENKKELTKRRRKTVNRKENEKKGKKRNDTTYSLCMAWRHCASGVKVKPNI